MTIPKEFHGFYSVDIERSAKNIAQTQKIFGICMPPDFEAQLLSGLRADNAVHEIELEVRPQAVLMRNAEDSEEFAVTAYQELDGQPMLLVNSHGESMWVHVVRIDGGGIHLQWPNHSLAEWIWKRRT